jgi:hypothetical protein
MNLEEDYMAFVARAKKNPIAAKVRLADIDAKRNLDVLRLESMEESDLARVRKYHAAWRLFKGES